MARHEAQRPAAIRAALLTVLLLGIAGAAVVVRGPGGSDPQGVVEVSASVDAQWRSDLESLASRDAELRSTIEGSRRRSWSARVRTVDTLDRVNQAAEFAPLPPLGVEAHRLLRANRESLVALSNQAQELARTIQRQLDEASGRREALALGTERDLDQLAAVTSEYSSIEASPELGQLTNLLSEIEMLWKEAEVAYETVLELDDEE